ncbi:mitochondrial ribosomal protein 10 [Lasiosphaeria hispida]|uniref:Small ribosomal subunit protein mS37 n=1 Tax=Lasiosphaeria hispida TaxID=260671 RepID=A0AAJ0HD01_9PEZI|nr:mitochondrial ribosomal protein 10 [Lasiosphaeria hispida]
MAPQKSIRLPPLQKLRVREPNKAETNPCIMVMSQVLACWASTGFNTAGCATVEQSLRACMDKPRAPPKPNNSINYHLSRFSERLTQKPSKKK